MAIRIWLVIWFCLAAVMIFASTMPVDQLKVNGGQIWVVGPGERNPIPLSALTGNDTLCVWNIEALSLVSESDSIFVTKRSRYVPVLLVSDQTERQVYIWFASSDEQYNDMVGLLRKYREFSSAPVPALPSFAYSLDADGLAQLRKKYDLDKVAGDGSQISKMLNLNRWVHGIVRHDGNSFNPAPRNALNLIQVCVDSNRGVNCRMMATILNEACLALGLKSRHLTCFPADKNDGDCHVVNMVWSDSLGKWVLLDPTFVGYFTNPHGDLLSPQEVRNALIAGDSIVINADLDYNGQPKDQLEYKSYMAKNLFRFSTPLVSAFNYESQTGERAWVYLNPLGYDSARTEYTDTTSKVDVRYIDYYTSNADWFWEKPR